MKVMGVGTDIVDKGRIAELYEAHGDRFVARILSAQEISAMQNIKQKAAYIAKRFAAKEAVAKALGCGIGQFLAFTDISVLNTDSGQPYVALSEAAQHFASQQGADQFLISLSDEKHYAVAFVIAQTES